MGIQTSTTAPSRSRDMSLVVTSPLNTTTDNNTVESPGINHDPNFMLQLQRSTSQSQLNSLPPHLMGPPLNSILNQSTQMMNSQPLSPTASGGSSDFDDSDDSDMAADEDEENRKRRELMLRRPSYKRILEDLEGNNSNPEIKKEPIRDQIDCIENNSENQTQSMMPNLLAQQEMPNMNLLQSTQKYVFPNQTPVQLLTTSAGHDVTSINSMISLPNQTATMRSPYQQLPPGMLSPALFMTPQAITTQQQMAEDAAKKREIRLMKNRLAAKECRRKKKEYVKCLESRVQVLENQNKALIDELRSLKDLYLPKDGTSMTTPNRPSNSDTGLKEGNDSHQ